MPDYFKYQIKTDPEKAEIILAFLSQLPFDTFQENETGLDAFIPVLDHSEDINKRIVELRQQFKFEYHKSQIQAQNWNKIWESNFQAIKVADFCGIRADFHDLMPDVEYEILVNPKMAFGTGHHATTYMMIEHMQNLDFNQKKVLDFGCGTGILAILASKLGAKLIEAVDIEAPAYENTLENAQINDVSNIFAIQGVLKDVPSSDFDIILANINRNVILDALPSLYNRLNKNGKLIVSGFIEKDQKILTQAADKHGFSHLKTRQNSQWISMIFEKS